MNYKIRNIIKSDNNITFDLITKNDKQQVTMCIKEYKKMFSNVINKKVA